nr:carboxypeptidase regulatory-like domain-containing protein [Streptomyces sp. NRRL F-5126]
MNRSLKPRPPRRPLGRRIPAWLAVLGAAALILVGVQAPTAQAARPVAADNVINHHTAPAAPAKGAAQVSVHGKSSKVEPACTTQPKPGYATCYALRRTDISPVKGLLKGDATPSGFGATDLQSAYDLPANGGAGQTVAVVDAQDDPNAGADLAVYRAQYGLPACTSDDGCFTKVDQRGGTDYPAPDPGWAGEISLDLDMVSAAAPNAHILLVEADSASFEDLGAAVDEAVALGAKYVSNSYGTSYTASGGGEDPSEATTYDPYYNHPGVAVVASSGDDAYGVAYPAASPYVTSVGGTALTRDGGTDRGWSESVWHNSYGGPGSGCSAYEAKPAFQTDTGCDKRAVSDVSAVADPVTGVSVYVTYGGSGWAVYGGTSASSPLIAGVYAAAGTPADGTYPNSYPYAAAKGTLNDVTSGSNGTCSPSYLCTATTGYDGPTGLGTPHGVAAFTEGAHGSLSGTVTDGSTGDAVSGATVTATAGDTTVRAKTEADGTYSLTLAPGSYSLSVDAFGYATASEPAVKVDDGATVTKDVTLTAVGRQTVSGRVTDGSGHGWPLYARVSVGDDASVWTDPATGAYTLPLPSDHDYTLTVTSAYSGYRSVTKKVSVKDAAVSASVSVPVDPFAGGTPGYTFKDDGTTEPFDSTTAAPEGWSVVNAPDTEGGWQFDDPGGRGNHTGGDGAFAIVDSDHLGSSATQDTSLVSPVYDLSGAEAPEMSFRTDYKSYSGQQATVEATSDGGSTWTTVWTAPAQDVTGPDQVTVPLKDFAGKSSVRLRFHYTGHFAWWWQVDDVMVGQRLAQLRPGGLVEGVVTDANTKDGLVAANVSGADGSQVGAATAATLDDPNLPDGFYWAFATPGKQPLTASKHAYTDRTKQVAVAADSAVKADFSLKAGRLEVKPGKIGASVKWGGGKTKRLTVTNTGSEPATLDIAEGSGTVTPAGHGAPLQKVKGDFSPLSAAAHQAKKARPSLTGPSDDAWQSAGDLPTNLQDLAADTHDGKVYAAFGFNGAADVKSLYSYDPGTGAWTQGASASDTRESPAHGFIGGKWYIAGGWGASGDPDGKLEIYDPAADAWTTGAEEPSPLAGAGSAVLDGKLYAVGGCTGSACGSTAVNVYDPAADSWSTAAPYPVPVSWEACGAIKGELYCAGGNSDAAGALDSAYVYDPAADSWSALPDLPTALWASSYTAANGQLLVTAGVEGTALTNKAFAYDPAAGAWSALPNANQASYRGGGASGFYKVGGAVGNGQPIRTVELLPGYDQQGGGDVSWLSEGKDHVTLKPGATARVAVTLDASVPDITQPGTYGAELTLSSDTPYALPSVPVTLTVAPPKTWGKITGKVLGSDGKGGTAALAGATVQIDSWATHYTLKTGADGTYQLWLDTRNNPLTLIVAKDGYQPKTSRARLKRGGTVTVDYTLDKA